MPDLPPSPQVLEESPQVAKRWRWSPASVGSVAGLVVLGSLTALFLYFDGVVLFYIAFWTSPDLGSQIFAIIYGGLAVVVPAIVWQQTRHARGSFRALAYAFTVSLFVSIAALPLVVLSLGV